MKLTLPIHNLVMSDVRKMVKSDLNRVNMMLQRAFTQGRVDDGYQHTHVPMCCVDFLEMYHSSCPDGCCVIEHGGKIVAAAFCHVWGQIGWIGPLAVLPENQLLGIGKRIAHCAIEFLKNSSCTTIGLETNPRSIRNLGFYSKLGFLPSTLVVDMIRRVPQNPPPPAWDRERILTYSQCSPAEQAKFLEDVRQLVSLTDARIHYDPLIQSIALYHYGDSVLIYRNDVPVVYTTMQYLPSSSEEKQSILRLLSLVAHPKTPDVYLHKIMALLETISHAQPFGQILWRIPIKCLRIYQYLLGPGFRIIHSDLRMVLQGYPEVLHSQMIHVDRWV